MIDMSSPENSLPSHPSPQQEVIPGMGLPISVDPGNPGVQPSITSLGAGEGVGATPAAEHVDPEILYGMAAMAGRVAAETVMHSAAGIATVAGAKGAEAVIGEMTGRSGSQKQSSRHPEDPTAYKANMPGYPHSAVPQDQRPGRHRREDTPTEAKKRQDTETAARNLEIIGTSLDNTKTDGNPLGVTRRVPTERPRFDYLAQFDKSHRMRKHNLEETEDGTKNLRTGRVTPHKHYEAVSVPTSGHAYRRALRQNRRGNRISKRDMRQQSTLELYRGIDPFTDDERAEEGFNYHDALHEFFSDKGRMKAFLKNSGLSRSERRAFRSYAKTYRRNNRVMGRAENRMVNDAMAETSPRLPRHARHE